jgi:hypothetical protein
MTSTLFRIAIASLLVVVLAIAMWGCRTPDDGNMPWNTPQPWEGNPRVPGMPQE